MPSIHKHPTPTRRRSRRPFAISLLLIVSLALSVFGAQAAASPGSDPEPDEVEGADDEHETEDEQNDESEPPEHDDEHEAEEREHRADCPEAESTDVVVAAGIVATFDFAAGQLPEGVAVDRSDNVFVSLAPTGQLLKFAPGAGDYEVFGSIPNWTGQGAGFLGLTVDERGDIYGAAQSAGSSGVWRFDCNTGEATLIPGTEAVGFPNSLAFDGEGNLYVSDSFSGHNDAGDALGAIWRINEDGNVDKWVESAAMGGLGIFGFPTPIGINGIAHHDGVIYFANTEKSGLFSVQVLDDKSAGTPSQIHQGMIGANAPDGITLDADGAIISAGIAESTIYRTQLDGTREIVAMGAGDGLDLPSSVAFGTGEYTRNTLYAVNLVLSPAFTNGIGPALVAIDMDTPGMPLP